MDVRQFLVDIINLPQEIVGGQPDLADLADPADSAPLDLTE
jgi:hypothetical protein